eukprot:CAMPEP_0183462534 /NCGR_PEP_ID=MMETSP0370-20130417/141857_1 /TAXON_ID=268820 /ORGANISM="Peridinium aciculiferum, Strain PAER-2" /LENGTH=95 /DNA_ID=CAMNT_0025654569 /DNA_START=1 /DNA_END=285 /DNA_ORIENTATION=+
MLWIAQSKRDDKAQNAGGYVFGHLLESDEVIRPDAWSTEIIYGKPVFHRADVTKARSRGQWKRLGKLVRDEEAPVKYLNSSGQGFVFALFGDWQV